MTDHEIRDLCRQGASMADLHAHFGLATQCGKCLEAVQDILNERPAHPSFLPPKHPEISNHPLP